MSTPSKEEQTREVTAEELRRFRSVLGRAIEVAEAADIPYLVAGSTASNVWGRPTAIGDIDLVVKPTDAKRLLKAFEEAGFEPEESEPSWLYKATDDDVTVDIIFEMEGDLYVDDDMVDKGQYLEVEETKLRVMGPEDYVVSQAMSTKEDTPDYWYNALGVLAKTELDWDYLVKRATVGPKRVLSLLVYAQANDLMIPDDAISRLYDDVYRR
jgi:predicted nucleotidyltransferase